MTVFLSELVVYLIMLSACCVQPDSAAQGYYGDQETELKVELTERLFAQDTDNEVSALRVLAQYYTFIWAANIYCLNIAFIISDYWILENNSFF